MGKEKEDFFEEIEKRMPELKKAPDEYRDTLFEVSEFLRRDVAADLEETLGVLETAMHKEIQSRYERATEPLPKTEYLVDEFSTRCRRLPKFLQHVLTTVLTKHEKELGFAIGSDSRGRECAPTYLGYVGPEEFRQRLTEGMQFKDPTVPGGHGEFTHRIQWYLITKEVKPPEGGWVEFYKWIGEIKHTVEPDEDKGNPSRKDYWKDLGLWDVVVDRNKSDRANANGPYNTARETDFRSPENLHHYIQQTLPQTCPLLSSFISRRESKRASGLVIQLADESEMAEMRRKELQDYAALKMHNKIYEELPLPRKAEVDRALQSGILPWERIPPMKQ
jgi:hypothetical protein